MEAIIQALKEIERIPGSFVDRNFGQGFEILFNHFAQLKAEFGIKVDNKYVNDFIKWNKSAIEKYKLELKPYSLPSDYVFFLEYCGGLHIDRVDEIEKYSPDKGNYYFNINGIGPMAWHWYSLIGDETTYTNFQDKGLIDIGSLSNHSKPGDENSMFSFFMDLGGVIRKNSVLGIREYNKGASLDEIFANFNQYPEVAKISANSFTEWFELIAQTQGTLDYL
jgi:hypothetical protein